MHRVRSISAHVSAGAPQASPTAAPQTPLKVTVCGAAGGIGQSLSLLLKLDPAIDELALYDVVDVVKGVAVDLSHCDSVCRTQGGFGKGPGELATALKGARIVVVPAGVPRKPGMTRDDLFKINAGINKGLADA